MTKIQINLVRHGETIFNHQGTVQGWGDSFLTPNGIQGVKNLGNYWKQNKKEFDAVYTSDSGRTLQTTRVLLHELGEKHIVNPHQAFREYNFGHYEGGEDAAVFEEVFARMSFSGNPADRTKEDMVNYLDTIAIIDREVRGTLENIYLSESYVDYAQRIVSGFEEVVSEAREQNYKNILIVSHGLTIQTLMNELFEKELGFMSKRMGNASVSSFYLSEDGTLEFIGFAEPHGN